MSEETARAEAIASQVIDLDETQILALTVPESLPDPEWERFKAELQRILDGSERNTEKLAVVVLREGMKLEALDAADLKKIGLVKRSPDSWRGFGHW